MNDIDQFLTEASDWAMRGMTGSGQYRGQSTEALLISRQNNMKYTFENIKKEVKRMDKNLSPNSDHFKSAVILLSACIVGANKRRVAKFTGYPESFLTPRFELLRKNGVFVGGKVNGNEWSDPESGGVAFWCDVAVAEGLLKTSRGQAQP